MAILEMEIFITLHNKTINHYEDLGYKIPRYIDSRDRNVVKRGTKIKVKIEDLPKDSNVKITKICDDCSKFSVNYPYSALMKQRNKDGKDRCKTCSSIRGGETQKESTPYERSLEFFSINNNKEHLLLEYSDKNKKMPSKVSKGTHDEYFWNCSKCDSEYKMGVYRRTGAMSQGCPYCHGMKVNNTNSLWTTHPDVAKLLKHSNIGHEITIGVKEKQYFTCPNCKYDIARKTVNDVNRRGLSCPRCSDGISYPEKFMSETLSQLNVNFETQKIFEWSKDVKHDDEKLCGNKKYDFYIPDLNCIIETHGGQHYKKSFETCGGKNLKQEIENDRVKESLALNNNISNYIIIDCSYSDFSFIKNNIINSGLNKYFDLSRIDWNICHEQALSSMVKKVCDIWNKGLKSTDKIGLTLHICKGTAIKYLKQGSVIGWCDYNPKEIMCRKIIQLTKNMEYIKEWESIKNPSICLNMHQASIQACCSGKNKTSGGFKWMYLEDYEKYTEETQESKELILT